MTATSVKPLPVGWTHDDDGRLIRLVFDSTPPLPSLERNPLLVAVDGSANALRAVAHAARQAAAMHSCSVHLVHVQPWLSKEAADAELAPRALAATAQALAALDAAGLPWRLHVMLGDPAEQITACALELQVSDILIGSRGLGVVESLLFGSVAGKVIQLASVPVTVVP